MGVIFFADGLILMWSIQNTDTDFTRKAFNKKYGAVL